MVFFVCLRGVLFDYVKLKRRLWFREMQLAAQAGALKDLYDFLTTKVSPAYSTVIISNP